MAPSTDVVVVGGGIAGGALALALARNGIGVTLLERLNEHRDLVRGELLQPWGLAEGVRLGVADALYSTRPNVLRRWVQWDETHGTEHPPTLDLTSSLVKDAPGVLCVSHYRASEALVQRAAEAGAEVHMGISDLVVRAGASPEVSFRVGPHQVTIATRLIVGAGGRAGPVGRQLGVQRSRQCHHWGGGLLVEGLEGWPQDVLGMGSEGDVMFFVAHQGDDRTRLYLNYSSAQRDRFAGTDGWRRFLRAFDLKCLPQRESIVAARPVGPCGNVPSENVFVDKIVADGAVLIGDEAGSNDPVLGTGLSNSLRDARVVTETLLNHSAWPATIFDEYVAERYERLRRLVFLANLLSILYVEFGPQAVDRRRRAWARMRENQNFMTTLIGQFSGPEHAPQYIFSDFFTERLLDVPARGKAVGVPRLAQHE